MANPDNWHIQSLLVGKIRAVVVANMQILTVLCHDRQKWNEMQKLRWAPPAPNRQWTFTDLGKSNQTTGIVIFFVVEMLWVPNIRMHWSGTPNVVETLRRRITSIRFRLSAYIFCSTATFDKKNVKIIPMPYSRTRSKPRRLSLSSSSLRSRKNVSAVGRSVPVPSGSFLCSLVFDICWVGTSTKAFNTETDSSGETSIESES